MESLHPRPNPEPLTGDHRRIVVQALAAMVVRELIEDLERQSSSPNVPPAPATRDGEAA
jgi:hypothetical protein